MNTRLTIPLRRGGPGRQDGVSMVEVMVTLVILLVGLLGLAGLMAQSQRSEMESYQRMQALTLLQDMAGRMNANRIAAHCYAYTTASAGSPYLGYSANYIPACTSVQLINYFNQSQISPYSPVSSPTAADTTVPAATAVSDLGQWSNELQGAAESSGTGNVGAMLGARGCITYDATTELQEFDQQSGLPTGKLLLGTGVYTVSIAWQGIGDTAPPPTPLTCGTGLYMNSKGIADDAQRRVVSLNFRMAALTK